MIFKADRIDQILDHRKTETRRPAIDRHRKRVPCRYRVGADYAIQPGRGKTSVGRLIVVAVELQRLDAIDISGARREGFFTRRDFFAAWEELYGKADPGDLVYAIRFQVLPNA